MRSLFKSKKTNTIIPIFGAGGTGKTTLYNTLTKQKLEKYYRPSIETNSSKTMILRHPLVIIDVPGQQVEAYTINWQDEIKRYISNRKAKIVLYMVSYGYHAITHVDNYQQTKYYRQLQQIHKREEIPSDEFIEEYFHLRRLLEIELFEQQLKSALILSPNQDLTLITVVNKQDLWDENLKYVSSHYEDNRYAYKRIINEIKQARNIRKMKFNYEFVYTSTFIQNFRFGNVKTINKLHHNEYDEIRKSNDLDYLINTINEYL